MKPPLVLAVTLVAAFSSLYAADDYQPGPDSLPQEKVPKGEVLKFTFDKSKIFPGTTRDYWIYVSRLYNPEEPACLFVDQDGVQFSAPVVFDNLIARRELPVIIGVFVAPGKLKAANADALDRYNRSLEYDGLGPDYARFLIEELLPDAETKTATDGRAIKFSKKPDDHAIAGSSSGGIAAFTAAWERPDFFRRVFTSVGTYIGLRGGNNYPTLIRKVEPKPLRVFLQDGSNDANGFGGNFFLANQEMESAFVFAGYEINHIWGDGGHNGKHATAIFPDAMRWLWKDWPKEITAGKGSPQLQEILIPGEAWQLVSEGHKFTEGAAVNAKGEFFFNDVPTSKTYKVGLDGMKTEFIADSKKGDGQAFGPDGRLYQVAGGAEQIVSYDDAGQAKVVAEGFRGNDLVVRHDGSIYVTEPGWDGKSPSKIWLITAKGEKKVVDTGLKFSNGITLSPDQTLLYVDDTKTKWVYSWQIKPDGTLDFKQRYFHLHEPDIADDSGADGMEVDAAGRLYVATRMGVQVCDQAGRVTCIIPTPNGKLSNLAIGGADFDTLFATCGDKVYKRKMKIKAAQSFAPPIKPAPPKL